MTAPSGRSRLTPPLLCFRGIDTPWERALELAQRRARYGPGHVPRRGAPSADEGQRRETYILTYFVPVCVEYPTYLPVAHPISSGGKLAVCGEKNMSFAKG